MTLKLGSLVTVAATLSLGHLAAAGAVPQSGQPAAAQGRGAVQQSAPAQQSARAAQPAAAAPSPQDVARLEGAWVRADTVGVGSFDGLAGAIPKAELKPGVAAGGGGGRGGGAGGGRGGAGGGGRGAAADTGPHEAGQPYIVSPNACAGALQTGGGRLTNPDSGGVHLVIAVGREAIFAGERGGFRHIYLDGRPQNPIVPRAQGYSVGHFEGADLVVDTTGMTPGAVPGGGMRTPATHLIERFHVEPDGKAMTITYTYDDPAIYAKPHTYSLRFDRAPGNPAYAMEEWCDASDPVEKQSIVPPEQVK